jgi:hypothetical protein
MTDQDDRLSADLQEYYRRMAQQPAPDVTGRVMMAAGSAATRLRLFVAIGGGVVAAGAVAAVVAVALLNHHPITVPAPAHTPTPSASPVAVAPTPTPLPTQQPVVGPAVHGFVPTDVTAVSASQWWVLGYNGPSCSSASCTRILHTTDAGATFTSVPPPDAPAPSGQLAVRLRFADPADGWVVDAAGTVWGTHDGGAHWTEEADAASVTDLEATGGVVYAIACTGSVCRLESSPTAGASWSTLPGSPTGGYLRSLVVNGGHIWAIDGGAASTSLQASSDGGLSFSALPVCPGDLGISNIYAVDATVMWATCATGTQAGVLVSTDGGRHFANLGDPGISNSSSIAGVSATTPVVASGQQLERSTDGGHTFATVASGAGQWSIVGFTTSTNGFAFDGSSGLWRTNDAAAHWYQVQFP